MTAANANLYRLPRSVLPSHYDITLEPDLDAGTFAGAVTIAVAVQQPVSELVFNAVDLELTGARMTSAAGVPIGDVTVRLVPEFERAVIALPAEIPSGDYSLGMSFRGALNQRLLGLYQCRFRDARGAERSLAVTQLQGTNARRVFPCFDEPSFKATFGVTVVVPDGLDAVSNTPIAERRPHGNGRQIIRFDRTIAMPPYLLAVVVGPLSASPAVDVDGVALRTLYVGDRGHLAEFSLDLGRFALRFYTERYGLAYPGKKLDQVAIPNFAAAGMENFGCITFREVVVLLDRDRVSTAELVRSADVITHEMAHMWFGDLVTMTWWNELWLNEAFATFMGMCCVEAYNVTWKRWSHFALERSKAFEVDSLESTRPLEFPVESPLQALGMLDVLTYRKGAALLRMLEQFLGSDAFFAGVNCYLRTHAYGNATGDDLWAAIELATQQPVARMMKSWIFQKGYPIITVSLTPDHKRLMVTQRLFRFAGLGTDDGTRFIVPLRFRTYDSDGTAQEQQLLLDEQAANVDLSRAIDGVVVNAGGHGFYRVRYEPSILRSLVSRARDWQMSAEERYMLIDDCWATVLEGTMPVLEFLEFVASMPDSGLREWMLLAGALDATGRIVDATASASFQAWVRELAAGAFRRLGWEIAEHESSESRELRGVLIRLLGTTAGAGDVVARSRALHDQYMQDPYAVEPNLTAAVTAVVARNGGDDDYDVFVQRASGGFPPQELLRYQRALGEFPGKRHMERTLAMCLNDTIKTQDAPIVLSICLSNQHHGRLAWQFVKDNWESISRTYSPIAIVPCLASVTSLDQPDVAEDVLAFFRTHEVPQSRQMLQHLERLRVNVSFRQREGDRLTQAMCGLACNVA